MDGVVEPVICGQDAAFNVGDAVSAGFGLGLGLFLVPYMFQNISPSDRIIKTVIVCLSCGGKNAEDFKFCGYCGRSLYPPRQVLCPKCGTKVPDMKFCENCGAKFKK